MPIKGRHALPIGTLFVASLLFLAGFAAATTVQVSGRQLLVNGSPFTMRGVSYEPVPVGSRPPSYIYWDDAGKPYLADFSLIKAMGANTVHVYNVNQASEQGIQAVLDAASANGLYVIMGFYVNPVNVGTSLSQTAAMAAYDVAFSTMAARWSKHPAVLMWEFGNEVTNSASPADWFPLLNQAAGDAKTAEKAATGGSFHPVGTSNQDITDIGTYDAAMTNLDMWGPTVYRGLNFSCSGNVFALYSALSSKPMYLSEFGQIALNTSTKLEDQVQQSASLTALWATINSNLSANNPSNVLVGGNVFEWTDGWWKALGANNTSDGVQDAVAPDWYNSCGDPEYEEWWGITSIESGDSHRGLRQAYYTLQSSWAPSNVSSSQNLPLITWVRNFPNPFSAGSGTRLQIQLSQPATLSVQIYDMSGHKVNELAGPQDLGSNLMQYQWHGDTGGGNQAACGLYIARVEASSGSQDVVQYRRMVIVK